jgi:hypothetical protein
MNTYAPCGYPVKNVVALKEPVDGSMAKRLSVDRGTIVLEKAHGHEYYQIKLFDREANKCVALIPLHFIDRGRGQHIKSRNGLKKNMLEFELNEVFNTNTDYLERITVKMDRADSVCFVSGFLSAWKNDERRRNKNIHNENDINIDNYSNININ